ncbi:carbohydrate ABC transporter permease [Paenibacillus lutrae]|uniref:ABC transporter permease subunit n=1 Tax=Paenibacillus lutrae TaxID=2078573 RepID=A0A7X3FEF0_9BACL|nr:carbohydrate ABC transporter permease [Paenibacillus lutrae]MVO98174.1 ABC transporter permease subunit [Paenibacillus lutrae]
MVLFQRANQRAKFQRTKPLVYILLALILVLFLFPVYWLVSVSLRTNGELFQFPPRWFPAQWTFQSYRDIVLSKEFLMFYRNTAVVAAGSSLLTILVSVLAGYGFSRFRFRGSHLLLVFFLSSQMFPAVTLLIGLYTLYSKLHLLNTLPALILAATTTALPFSIMMMKTFIDGIGGELEEAAEVDGATRLRALVHIILPLTKPGIMAVTIYTFLVAWDDFLFGMTLVRDLEMRTLSPGLSLTFLGEFNTDWSGATAAAVTATTPLVVLFLFLQRYMVEGLTAGGIKE